MGQRAEFQTTQSAGRLHSLVDITRLFAGRTGNAELLYRTIAEQAGRLFGGYCLLGLIGDDGTWRLAGEFSPHPAYTLELRRAFGARHTDTGGAPVTPAGARAARLLSSDDTGTDAWKKRLETRSRLIVERIEQRGAMCVPLRAQNEVIGTISVGRMSEDAPRFEGADLDLLRLLAEHATQTILHSRSLDSMQREVADHRQTRDSLRRTQEGLLQAAKMEALGRLASGVAHDFNNILSIIVGYSELLLEGNSFAREDVEEIHRASLRASALTKQLLAFSRKEPYAPGAVDLNQIIGGMRPMLQRLLGEQVELQVNGRGDLPACHIDPTHADQVLMNLAINAKDAMPNGGQLTIETSQIVLDDEYVAAHPGATPGPHVMLSISDTGTGMPEDVRVRIFEPFFTTKPRGVGTGLGLATVSEIVRQCGGHISVYSELGRGTTFRLAFPVARAAAAASAREDSPGK